MQNIQALNLSNNNISSIALNAFDNMPNLVLVDLVSNPIADQDDVFLSLTQRYPKIKFLRRLSGKVI